MVYLDLKVPLENLDLKEFKDHQVMKVHLDLLDHKDSKEDLVYAVEMVKKELEVNLPEFHPSS